MDCEVQFLDTRLFSYQLVDLDAIWLCNQANFAELLS